METKNPVSVIKKRRFIFAAAGIIILAATLFGILYFSANRQNTLMSATSLLLLLSAFMFLKLLTNKEYDRTINLIGLTDRRLQKSGLKTVAEIRQINGLFAPKHKDPIHLFKIKPPMSGEIEVMVRSSYQSEDLQTEIGKKINILIDPQNPQIATIADSKAYLDEKFIS